MTNVSLNKKSPRNRIPESFRVERLESRVLLSADPVLTPLAVALMPHGMHVAALPHASADASAAHTLAHDGASVHALFNADSVDWHHAVLHPAQSVAAQDAHAASVSAAVPAASAAAPTMSVQSASRTTSQAMAHIMTAPAADPVNAATWTTNVTFANGATVNNSIKLSKTPTLTVTVAAGGSLSLGGGAGDDLYAATTAQNLLVVPGGAGGATVAIPATLPGLQATGLDAIHDLTIGSAAFPVTNITFGGAVNITGTLTIYATGLVTFDNAVNITNNGSLAIHGASNVTFDGAVALTNLDGTSTTVGATVTGAAGNIAIQADTITFTNVASSFTGSGTLSIAPTTAGRGIFFASPQTGSPAGQLVIDNSAIASWGSTFSSITIGSASTTSAGLHADGLTGAITIGGTQNFGSPSAPTVLDTIAFYGTSISVAPLAASSGTTYTFYGSGNVTFDAVNNISLSNTVIANAGNSNFNAYSANGSVSATGSATYVQASTITARANTGITLPSIAATNLSVTNAGATGSINVTQVTLEGQSGALNVIQALQSNAGSTGNISIATAGNPAALALPTIGGNLTVASSGTGVVTAGQGNISLVATGAGSTLTVSDNVTSRSGSVTLTAPGLVTVAAQTLTTGGAVNVTSSTDSIHVNANVLAAGGALALSAHNDIVMLAGTTLSSLTVNNNGAITLTAGGNDVLATLAAAGSMAVTATAGSISSALTEGTSTAQLNLNGIGFTGTGALASATLTSARGIGARGADIQTFLSRLTLSNSTTGDVFIDQTQTEVTPLLLGTAGGSAVTLGGDTGTASIVATDGGITVSGSITSTAVPAGGDVAAQIGNILIQTLHANASTANLLVGANVSSANGSIELNSFGTIAVGNPAAVTLSAAATGQTIWLQAGGNIVFAATSQADAAGNVWVKSLGGAVTLGEIASTGGIVAIDAGDAILNAQAAASQAVGNVTAANVRLSAVTGVGTSVNAVVVDGGTPGATFAGQSTGGGLYLKSLSTLSVGSVAATPVNVIGATATPGSTGDASALVSAAVYGASNLVLQATGDLRIESAIGLAGPVTIASVPTSTQVHLEASGTLAIDQSIGNIGSPFTAYVGNMSLLGAAGVAVAAGKTISTGGAGTLDVESSAGGVQMGALSLIKAINGGIRVQGAQDVAVARVQTAGNAAITSTAGNVVDSNGDGTTNVTAAGVRLASQLDIGSSGTELRVSTPTLSAAAAAGSAYVLDVVSETLGSVAVTVKPVDAHGVVSSSIDVAQNGASAGTNVVLQSSADLTLAQAVTATGAGNVLVQALGGGLTVAAQVTSATGNVSVLATGDIGVAQTIGSNGTGSTGSVDVESSAGNVLMGAGTLLGATGGAIRVLAAQSIALAQASTTGSVSLTATAGSITDANGNSDVNGPGVINVAAGALRLNASNALGSNSVALQTAVASVSAFAGAGGVYLLDNRADSVDTVAVAFNQVGANGAVTALADAAQAGLATTANGNIVLQATAGDLDVNAAVNANGSGNVLLQSEAGTLALLGDNVYSSGSSTGNGTGNISLWGATGVSLSSNRMVVTAGGTIDVESGAAVAMAAHSVLQSTSGAVGVQAATSVAVGSVQTNVGAAITALGGSITDANGNTNFIGSGNDNVVAGAVRLKATNAIGSTTDGLRIQATNLTASAGAGGAYLMSDASTTVSHATVGVRQVAQDGTSTATLTQALQNGVTASGGGNVVLVGTAGDVTLSATAVTIPAVAATGGGNVLVQTLAGTVNVNASVFSNASGSGNGTGNVSVLGSAGVNVGLVASHASVGTGSGSLDIESSAGSVAMSANALVNDTSGPVRLAGAQNVSVGRVTSGGNVQLWATAGTVTDADGNLDSNPSGTIDVSAAGLSVVAGAGVGTPLDALRTHVAAISAGSTNGSVYLLNDQAVTVGEVDLVVTQVGSDGGVGATITTGSGRLVATHDGNLVLEASAGDITLTDLVSHQVAVSSGGSGNVLVQADAGHVVVSDGVHSSTGNIALVGAQGVSISSAEVGTAGSVDIESGAGSVTMTANSWVHGDAADVRVAAAQDIALGRITTLHDVSLVATAGSVTDATGNVDGASPFSYNVRANGLRLNAGTGAGSGSDALQVEVNTLSENVGAGGGYVIAQESVTVGSVSASVNKTARDGTTSVVADAAQAGLVSRNNGNLVLQAAIGDVTLTSASPSVAAVNANGSGNVLLQSLAGAVDVDANVYSDSGTGAGNISLLGATGVNVGATGIVATVGSGGGTVDVESGTGSVAMSAHSVLASGGADVRVVAAQGISVGQIESGDSVALTAGGSIVDANGNSNASSAVVVDVASLGLRLNAGAGVGTTADALRLSVGTVAATVGTGGLFVFDGESFSVASVSTSIEQVGLDGNVTTVDDATLSGVTAAAGGDVVLQATVGDVTLGAAIAASGAANVRVGSASGAVDVDANVTLAAAGSASGSIALLGAAGVNVAAGIAVSDASAGASSLDVESANGSVQMATGSTFSASAVRVIAAQDIGLGQVLSAGNVALTATAGTISNATGAADNVSAAGLYLSAGTAAGTSGNPLLTHVATLSAAVGNGGMDVTNDVGFATGSVSVAVNQVALDGTTSGITTATAADAVASSGAVTLAATTGDIALNSSGASVAAINANGAGNVLVEAIAGSIAVNANVLDGSGNTAGGISLFASQAIAIGAGAPVNIVDGAGAMDIETFGGNITMGTASLLEADVGTLRVVGEGAVTLGIVHANASALVHAVTGGLAVDANVQDTASSVGGSLTLEASGDVVVAAGVVITDVAGPVDVQSFLGNVTLATSSLLQSSTGTVSVVGAQSVTTGQVQATGNTLLQAQGGTLQVNAQVRDGTGAQAGTLTLLATGDIDVAANVQVLDGAGRLDVESSAGNVALDPSSLLRSDDGTINVNAALGVTLGGVEANANTRVQARGGALAVDGTVMVGSGTSAGNLSLLASGDVVFGAAGLASSGAGSLDVESGGSVQMGEFGSLFSVTGAVRVLAAQDIAVGTVQTGGSVALTATAGSIADASGSLDVLADGVRLVAGNGIGQSGDPIDILANTLAANAGAGGIHVVSDQALAVGSVAVSVNQVATNGGAATVTDATLAGLATSANGSIALQATTGDITLTPAGGNAISADGSGNVQVLALAAGANVNAYAGITSGTGNIDVEADNNVVLYTPGSAAAQISTALPGLVNVHAVNGTVISGGTTAPGQTVNLNTDQLTLQAPLVGTDNQLNIGPATVASNPDAVVVGGPAAGGTGALYLSQQQIGLIESGFKDVQIGSTIPGQAVRLVGQDAAGNASTNVFVNPLTLLASGAGGTVSIGGGLQATSLDIEGSRTGTTLASANVSTTGAVVVNDNVVVTGATSITSGTGGAADLTVNGTITGSGAGNALTLGANGGNIVVTGAVSGLGALNVANAATLTFQSTLAVSGNVVINTTGAIDFLGGVTIAAGGSLTIVGATTVTFTAGADFTQAGNVKIAAGVLNFNGGAGSIHGAGVLTLQGATPAGAIHVGSSNVAGALNIGAQSISAIAPGFAQVVLGTVDASTGHASTGAGAVDIEGSASLVAFAAPLAVYGSTIAVDAGGSGVHVAGALTLDAVGQITLGSDVTTTVAAKVSLASATDAIQMAAQTRLGTLGGNVAVTTGNSSNATLAVIDTRATGTDIGASVDINVQHGRVIDANADANVNVYAAAVSMEGYGLANTAGSNQNAVLKVRAPIVYVASPTGVVVADAGQDGRTNYNAIDHATMFEELVAVGATTRVTLPGDAVLGAGPEALAGQGVPLSDALIHAAAVETFMSRLFSASFVSSDTQGVSLTLAGSGADAEPTGYVLGSLTSHPSVAGVNSYGDGTADWWTEALDV